jgi:hypothetical protein
MDIDVLTDMCAENDGVPVVQDPSIGVSPNLGFQMTDCFCQFYQRKQALSELFALLKVPVKMRPATLRHILCPKVEKQSN